MFSKTTPLLVGMMVLIGAASFIATFGSLDRGMSIEGSYEVFGTFDDAAGLVEQSRVMLSGIPVGEIAHVGLDPDDPARARVTLRIAKHVTLYEGLRDAESGVWRNGATATRQQASLLGDYYISITPGVGGLPIDPGGRIHNTIAESGIEKIVEEVERATSVIFPKMQQITEDISLVTAALREAMGGPEGVEAIEEMRRNVRNTVRDVAGVTHELRGFLNKRIFSHGDDIRRTVQNFEEASRTLKSATAKMSGTFDTVGADAVQISGDLRAFVSKQVNPDAGGEPGTIVHTLTELDKSIGILQETLETGRALAARAEQGDGTLGRLLTDTRLVDDAEHVISDIRDFTASFKQLEVRVDLGSEYFLDQDAGMSMRHHVDFSLYPRPDKFYFFQLTAPNLITAPTPEGEAVTSTSDLEDLKFTAQYGKRWNWLALRYGIMESSGGLGMDLHFFDQALQMKFDVFDFSRSEWPRLRMLAAWEFVKHLYIAGGVDDGINEAHRDFFVGFGIKFTDHDIKTILPVIPSPL